MIETTNFKEFAQILLHEESIYNLFSHFKPLTVIVFIIYKAYFLTNILLEHTTYNQLSTHNLNLQANCHEMSLNLLSEGPWNVGNSAPFHRERN